MKIIFMSMLFLSLISAQNISNTTQARIANLIVSNSTDIEKYILPEEFTLSNRFGIKYEGVNNKFFIANDFPSELSKDLAVNKNKYEYHFVNLRDNFSSLTVSAPTLNITREYFLKDSLIVSKPYYYSQNWKTIESDHFRFFISDETLFNDYSINVLEKFIAKIFNVLSFTIAEKDLIKQNKIYYFLCKDESEILKISDFATRGIFILAQDYVITTFNTHYHELLHFLINFKLKKLPLYTHPFLQEGFAVAFGGRGGLDAHTISEMGVYLVKSGFANYSELLSRKDFQSTDASISYPISGLYVDFLIKQIGIEKYLELYKKHSGSLDLNLIDTIDVNELPDEKEWNEFVDSLMDKNPVRVFEEKDYSEFDLIRNQNGFEVYQSKENYLFRIKDTLLISSKEKITNYQSKIFKEQLSQRRYNSEKYLIIANSNEVSIYNLYSNNLIGKYVASFSIPPKALTNSNGFYEFVVRKDLFDEVLNKNHFME